jgi:hypothetical protein
VIYFFYFNFQESAGGLYGCDQSVEVWRCQVVAGVILIKVWRCGGGLSAETPWGPSQG